VTALHIVSILSVIILVACFALCLRALHVRPLIAAIVILLLLLGDKTFSFRILLGRPLTLITALTLLSFFFLIRERFIALGFLQAILTLLSHLFLFPLLVSVVGAGILFVTGQKRRAALLITCALSGVAIGLAMHPLPLEYIRYLWVIFVQTPIAHLPNGAAEMRSGFGSLAIAYPVIALIVLVQASAWRWRSVRDLPFALALLNVLVVLFFVQFLLWVRAIDFFWPFLLLLLGAVLADSEQGFRKLLRHALPQWLQKTSVIFALVIAVVISAFAPLAASLIINNADTSLRSHQSALRNVESGSRILNVDWDRFSAFSAVRPDLRYDVGIDPMYTYVGDPVSHRLLLMIAQPDGGQPDLRRHIDIRSWLRVLLALHPADYIVLSSDRSGPIIEKLRSLPLTNVSGDPAWAVFDLQSHAEQGGTKGSQRSQ
jgi:hypothetical protein